MLFCLLGVKHISRIDWLSGDADERRDCAKNIDAMSGSSGCKKQSSRMVGEFFQRFLDLPFGNGLKDEKDCHMPRWQ